MKWIKGVLAAAAMAVSLSSFAHGHFYTDYYDQTLHPRPDSGVFLGLNFGYVVDNWDDFESVGDLPIVIYTITTDSKNYGYRVFLGYMFNKTWAMELGYTMLNKVDILITEPPVMMGDPDIIDYDEQSKTNIVDLFIRMAIPLNNDFSVFTKIGAAYMESKDAPSFQDMLIEPDKRNNFAVAFGAGFLYRIAKHWATDFSWLHYRGNGKIGSDFQPDIDFFSLSLALIFPT